MKISNWLTSITLGAGLGWLLMWGIWTDKSDTCVQPMSAALSSRDQAIVEPIAVLPPAIDVKVTTANVQTAVWLSDEQTSSESDVILCQGYESIDQPGWGSAVPYDTIYANQDDGLPPPRMMRGIDQFSAPDRREPRWRDGDLVPFENFAYGEYVGPFRTPHVDEYRVRVDDVIEFNFFQVREKTKQRYQLNVGDLIQISSPVDPSLNQPVFTTGTVNGMEIMPDGTISLALIGEVRAAGKTVQGLERELNERYLKFVRNPSVVVQVTKSQTPVFDLLDAVDSRFGQGGRARQAIVTPDGTLQLPFIGNVPSVGLSLDELAREVNARLAERVAGVEVTPVLVQRAPRFVYVLGEVRRSGRYELLGPTSALQAIALAEGFNRRSANFRQIIVFRRDQNWNLMATKLDLGGAAFGKRPLPSDEIWLRDSDIVLVPPKPIQRLSDAVNLYMNNTVYAFFPQQGVVFNFDDFNSL